MGVKHMVRKSVRINFGGGTTRPAAIGIFSEISTPDLGGECRVSFACFCLLSVCRIDVFGGCHRAQG
jgi:hypothetical protein